MISQLVDCSFNCPRTKFFFLRMAGFPTSQAVLMKAGSQQLHRKRPVTGIYGHTGDRSSAHKAHRVSTNTGCKNKMRMVDTIGPYVISLGMPILTMCHFLLVSMTRHESNPSDQNSKLTFSFSTCWEQASAQQSFQFYVSSVVAPLLPHYHPPDPHHCRPLHRHHHPPPPGPPPHHHRVPPPFFFQVSSCQSVSFWFQPLPYP